jgi:hypothetical protein
VTDRFSKTLMIRSDKSVSGATIRLPKKFMMECMSHKGEANELYFWMRAKNGRVVFAAMQGNSWVNTDHVMMAPAAMLNQLGVNQGAQIEVALVNGDGAHDAVGGQERPWLVQMGSFDRFEVRMEDAAQWALAASVPMEGTGGLKEALAQEIDEHHPVMMHGDLIHFVCKGHPFTVRVTKLYMPETERRQDALGAMQLRVQTATQPPLTITIDADPSDTTDDLKQMIEDRVQVPATQQRLFFNGAELISGSALSGQGISDGDPIRLQSSLDAMQAALFGRAAVGSSRGEGAEEGQGKQYRRDVPVVVRKMGGNTHGFEVLGPR